MSNKEIPLEGGNSNQVVKVGNNIHRIQGPQSPFVHALLKHLEAQGFTNAPKYVGVDHENREILDFVSGEVGNNPLKEYMLTDEILKEAAILLKKFHDAL